MNDPYVIAGHIRRALYGIIEHYDRAGDPPRVQDDGDPGREDPSSRPPADLHAIDVRREAVRDLSFWVRFILDEVNNGDITTRVDGHDVPEMARFVITWALALAEQHPGDASGHREACREELSAHARRLKAVAHGTRTRRIEVGPCPQVDLILDEDSGLEELKRCDGTIVATLTERDPDNEDDGLLPQHLTCTIDGTHTWQPWQWADVGRQIERMAG